MKGYKCNVKKLYKSVEISNKDVKMLLSDEDLSDFQSPKPEKVKTLKWKIKKAVVTPRKKRGRKKKQQSNPTLKIIEDNFKHSENPEHLQMAIALSKSIYDQECQIKGQALANEETPNISDILSSHNKPSLLEKYGFTSHKSVLPVNQKRILEPHAKSKSRFKYITPILNIRTTEEQQSIIDAKIAIILAENKPETSYENCKLNTNKISSTILERYIPKRKIFYSEYNSDNDFYVDELDFSKSNIKCGYLLRDWQSIPCREVSPCRETSSCRNNRSEKLTKLTEPTNSHQDLFSMQDRKECYIDEEKLMSAKCEDDNIIIHNRQSDFPSIVLNKSPVRTISPDLFGSDVESENEALDLSPIISLKQYSFSNSHKTKKDSLSIELARSSKSNRENSIIDIIDLTNDNLKDFLYKPSNNSTIEVGNKNIKNTVNIYNLDDFENDNNLGDNTIISENLDRLANVENVNMNLSLNKLSISLDHNPDIKYDQRNVNTVASENTLPNNYFSEECITQFNYNLRSENKDRIEDISNSELSLNGNGTPKKYTRTNNKTSSNCKADKLNITTAIINLDDSENDNGNTVILENWDNLSNVRNVKTNFSLNKLNISIHHDNDNKDDQCNVTKIVASEDTLPQHYFENFSEVSIMQFDENLRSENEDKVETMSNFHPLHISLNETPKKQSKINYETSVNCTADKFCNSAELNITHYIDNMLNQENYSFDDINSEPGNLNTYENMQEKIENVPGSQGSQNSTISDEELNYSSYFGKCKNIAEPNIEIEDNHTINSAIANNTSIEKAMKSSDKVSHSCQQKLTPNKLVIKTDNVTPMPNYDAMSTPILHKELDKFGLKPLKRTRGTKLLKHIYESTHPIVNIHKQLDSDGSDTEENRKTKKIKLTNVTGLPNNHSVSSDPFISLIEIVGDCILENEKLEDLIFERKRSVKISSCAIPLQIVWHNFVSSNKNIRQSILLYEPLQLETIHMLLKEHGYKFHIQDLLTFLDKKCITIRTVRKSNQKKS